MVFTNDELRNPVTFDPSDPMTWTVSDWETCWAMRGTDATNQTRQSATNEGNA